MVTNRSVPVDTVLPHIAYRDVAEASRWLTAAFGFTEHFRYGPPDAPSGAQMHLTRLPPDKLAEVLEGTGTAIDEMGGSFTMHYATVAVTAARTGAP